MRSMKIERLLALATSGALCACGGKGEDPIKQAADSQRPSAEEIAAVQAETSYRAPVSPNPKGVTEDDIVLLRDGDHYKMGYEGKDGEFIEIPERGTLPYDASGFLPPYRVYREK
jgi:hypothetical protein